MTGEVVAVGFVPGLGKVYVEEADRPDFLQVTVIKTGGKYLRRRKDITFRPAKYSTTPIS
jgi:hypothetical protein